MKLGLEKTVAAVNRELDGFRKLGILCEPTEELDHLRPLPCLLCLTEKRNGDIRARIVVMGSRQRPFTDFDPQALYAPVIDRTSTRVIYALAAALRAHLHTFDVRQAFLNGDMTEDVYIRLPAGVMHDGPSRGVFKLRKSLYGIRQAPKIWSMTLATSLKEIGLVQCKADSCLYYTRTETDLLVLGVHVDDGLVMSTSETLLDDIMVKLKDKFDITTLGPIDGQVHVGTTVHHDRENGTVHLSVGDKIEKLLRDHGLTSLKNAPSPSFPPDFPTRQFPSAPEMKTRAVLGSLQYLSDTVRPDITTATSILASSVDHENPSLEDRARIARVCAYLKACQPHTGLHFDGSIFDTVEEALLPRVFVDADFQRNGDCRSRSGAVVFLANAPVFWMSKRQSSVATSSTQSEVVVISEVCKTVVWLRRLLAELGFHVDPSQVFPSPVYEDNQAALTLVSEFSGSSKSRHFMPRFMWVRSLVDDGDIVLEKVASHDNIGDFFTKIVTLADQCRFIHRLVKAR